MTAPLFAVDAVRVTLPDGRAVGPLSFALGAGECIGLVGESGSGKSVCAQALAAVLPAPLRADGALTLDGRACAIGTPAHAALRGSAIGYMFQDALAALHPLRALGAQLEETLRAHGVPRRDVAARARTAFAEVGLDMTLLARRPHQLSGGQRQRALLALTLAPQPRVLIADEPTSALDVHVQRGVLDLLQALRRTRGLALVFIGHDLAVVAELADTLCVLRSGDMQEQGATGDVVRAPQSAYTRALLAAQHPPVGTAATAPGEPLCTARALSVRYPHSAHPAVDAVDVELRRGEALALVGQSGSGKSTLGRALLGLQAASGGALTLAGADTATLDRSQWKALRRRVQIVLQDPYASLDPRQRVRAIVAEPRRVHGLPVDDAWLAARLHEVGLPAAVLDRYPHQFSGGQRQRIAIARALATDPELLVCDEAVSALDALVRAQIVALLQALRTSRGLTLLFITHDLDVAAALAERIAVMHDGRIVEAGSRDDVLSAPQHPYTRRLLAARPTPLPVLEEPA